MQSGLVLEQGQVIAKKYVLDRPAGFGGMAQLWVATNQATAAEVCVKILVPEKGEDDAELVERFRREAHAGARLSHRAIVRVFDLLELDEGGQAVPRNATCVPHAYAIVMELLRGETLGDMLAKRGKIPLEEALDTFLPIVSALGHAHRADVVHRDLKPDNIFLATEPDGHVVPKVLDFGVSKLGKASAITIDGVLVGTPAFMSPEQAKGSREIDARSDVFSAGILLYMMLGGRNPFEDAPTFASIVDAILRREVTPLPDVPPAVWAVLERAIAKDPAERFADAGEMNIALRKAAGRRSPTESNPMLPLVPPSSSRSIAPPSSLRPSPPSLRPSPRTSLEPPLLEDRQRADGATRRRAIVAGVVGAASALVVAAGLVAVLGDGPRAAPNSPEATGQGASAPESTGQGATATPADPSATTTDEKAAPLPAATDVTAAPATAASGPLPPTAAATPSARPVAAPRRPHASAPHPPSTSTPRRAGEEPHKARDPGF